MEFLSDFSVFAGWIFAILLFIIGSTYVISRFKGVESHFVYSLWRSSRFRRFIEKQQKLAFIISIIAKIGVIFAFGFLASDFLFFRKKSKIFRIIAALSVLIVMSSFYYFALNPFLRAGPYLGVINPLLAFGFSFFGASVAFMLLFVSQGFFIVHGLIAGETVCPGIAPILPGVEVPGVPIFIPWFGWIGLIIAVILHESAHGIVSIKEKIGIKSAGLLLIGILPLGAFVEPDEQKMKKTKPESRMQIYSAGPSANLFSIPVFVLILFIFNTLFLTPVNEAYVSEYNVGVIGVEIVEVREFIPYCNYPPSPAYNILKPGMRVLEVNGIPIHNNSQFRQILAEDPLAKTTFKVEFEGKIEEHELLPDQMLGSFGFVSEDILKEDFELDEELAAKRDFLGQISLAIFWCAFIAFLIVFLNFLPVPPLDGGFIASELYSYYFLGGINDKNKKKIANLMIAIALISVFLSILPYFFM